MGAERGPLTGSPPGLSSCEQTGAGPFVTVEVGLLVMSGAQSA